MNPVLSRIKRCGPFVLTVLLAPIVLTSLTLASAAGAGEEPKERLKPEAFRAQFAQAFRRGDAHRMRELASGHRDLLRPSIETALEPYFKLDPEKEALQAKEALGLARAYAGLARDLSQDDFPLRMIGLYGSWPAGTRQRKSEADALLKDAQRAFEQGLYEEASKQGRRALDVYTSLKDRAGEGRALHYLGQAERKQARYEESIGWHERALALAEESGDRLGRGRALIDLADVYERKKDHPKAIELYQAALKTFRIPEDWQEAGRALRQLGDVYVANGEFESAYQAYGKALKYAEDGHDPTYIAWYNDYVGYFYRELGDYKKAIQAHRRSLASSEDIPDAEKRNRAQARAHNHLGLCFAKQAEQALAEEESSKAQELYQEALGHEEKALQAAEQAQDRWRLGYVIRALAFLHRELGATLDGEGAMEQYRRSLERAHQALELAREMREKEWEGLALHHIGMTQARMGRASEGLSSFRQALDIWEDIGDLRSMGHAHRFIGYYFYETRGELDEALAHYSRALEIFLGIRASEHIAAVHLSMGSVYESQGELDKAKSAYLKSIETLEAMRRKLTSEEHKLAFFERRLDPYESLIALLTKTYLRDSRREDGSEALRFSERARARTVLDLLQEASGKIRAGVDEETLRRERNLRSQYYTVTKELNRERSEERIASLRKRLELLDLEYNDLLRDMEERYPEYARLKNPQPLSLTEIQQTVLRKGEVLLEYFVGQRETYLFVLSRDELEALLVLPAGKSVLTEKVESLRLPFEEVKATKSIKTLEGFDLELARELYGLLLKPAEEHIRGSSRLLIVPHGPLFYLPFELLVTRLDEGPAPADVVLGRFEKARYVLEAFPPIAYAPSASVLDPRLRHLPSDSGSRGSLLAFGNPTAEGEAKRPGSVKMRGGEEIKLPPLPYAEQEAKDVAKLYGSGARVYLRDEATKDRFFSDGPGYPFLLLSTHGIFDERRPMYSALVFAPRGEEKGYELLETHEIFNMSLRADMVTLSACEVGLGRIRDGEGLVGMSRAFLYAGASSLVVSLWSVYDKSTSQLITGLHNRIRTRPQAKAQALKESKLEVLRTRQKSKSGRKKFSYAHPFFWAPFILVRGP